MTRENRTVSVRRGRPPEKPINPWWIAVAPATVFGLGAQKAMTLDPQAFDPVFREAFAPILPIVTVHAASGMITLVVGPWLFLILDGPARKLHRYLGRLYLVAVFTGSATGVVMGLRAYGGVPGKTSFVALALLWCFTGYKAFACARAGRWPEHRRWTTRNFLLTLSAVSLRLLVWGLQSMGWSLPVIYPWVAWLSWVPQIAVAEWWGWRSARRRGPGARAASAALGSDPMLTKS